MARPKKPAEPAGRPKPARADQAPDRRQSSRTPPVLPGGGARAAKAAGQPAGKRKRRAPTAAAAGQSSAPEQAREALDQFIRELRQSTEHVLQCRRRAAELAQRLTAARHQVDDITRVAAEVQTELVTTERQASKATVRLRAVRGDTAEAERHLSQLRAELREAEQRLREARKEIARAPEAARAGESGNEVPNRLGLTVVPAVRVAEIVPGSPAGKAELRPGDVIAAVNGTAISFAPELREAVAELAEGEEIALQVLRDGATLEVRCPLGAGPESAAPAEGPTRLGLTAVTGLLISDVQPGLAAASARMTRGDILASVNETTVETGTQLRAAIEHLEHGAEVRLKYYRGANARESTVRLDGATH